LSNLSGAAGAGLVRGTADGKTLPDHRGCLILKRFFRFIVEVFVLVVVIVGVLFTRLHREAVSIGLGTTLPEPTHPAAADASGKIVAEVLLLLLLGSIAELIPLIVLALEYLKPPLPASAVPIRRRSSILPRIVDAGRRGGNGHLGCTAGCRRIATSLRSVSLLGHAWPARES